MSVTMTMLIFILSANPAPAPSPVPEWAYETRGKIYASPVPVDLEGDGSIEILIAASRAQRLLCLNGAGALHWDFQIDDGDGDGLQATPSAVDFDGDGVKEVVFLTHGGIAGCVDASGRLRWRVSIGDKLDYTGPAVADLEGDGHAEIVFGSDSGTLYCLDDTGLRLWHYQGAGQMRGIPAIGRAEHTGTLLVYAVFGDGAMTCLDCEGRVLWSKDEPGPRGERRSSPAIGDLDSDGRPEVVSATEDFHVIAYDAWTGDERWRWKGDGNIDQANSFALADFDKSGTLDVVCGDSSGHVYRLRDGALIWRADVGGGVVQGPSIGDVDGDGALEVLVCSRGNRLACLSDRGDEKWRYSSKAAPLTTPALGDFDGDGEVEIVLAGKDRFIHCLSVGGRHNAAKLPWPMLARDPQLSGNAAGMPFARAKAPETATRAEALEILRYEQLRCGENDAELAFANTAGYRRRLELVAEIVHPDGRLVTRRVAVSLDPGERRFEQLVFETFEEGRYGLIVQLIDAGTGRMLGEANRAGAFVPFAVEKAEFDTLAADVLRLAGALTGDTARRARVHLDRTIASGRTIFDTTPTEPAKTRKAAVERIRDQIALLRRELSRLVAAQRSAVPADRFAVVADTTLRKVFRDEPYPAPDSAAQAFHVELARNEYEGIQAIVIPLYTALEKVTLSCNGLQHENGDAFIPSTNIEINPVGYVEAGPPEYNWRVPKLGWYPDVLLPNAAVDIEETQTAQPYFVSIHTEADTAPGRYTGTLRITIEGKPAGDVPLTAEVWDFALPAVPTLKTSFWMSEGDIARFYKFEGRAPFEVRKRFYDLHLKYLVSPIKDFPMSQGEDLEDFDYVMAHGQNCFFLPVPDAAGAARDRYAEQVRRADAYLDAKGWSSLGAFYTMDEVAVMQRHRIRDVQEMSAWLKSTFPEYPRLQTSAPEQALFGVADIWCPTIDSFDPNVLGQRMGQGERLWMYTVWGRPGIMIEFPATDHRLMFWECWKYGAEGFLYWGTTHWAYNLDGETRWPQRPWITHNSQPGHNGCGYLLYPGPDATPLASTRLHAVRDGIEDYEYLHLLRSLAEVRGSHLPSVLRERVENELAVDPAVVRDHKTFTEEAETVLDARRNIAASIHELDVIEGP